MSSRREIIKDILADLREEEEIPTEHLDECQKILEENFQPIGFHKSEIKLQHLRAKNFRALRDYDITFNTENTVFYGPNESGKTTMLEAIRFNLLDRQEMERIRLSDPIREADGRSFTLETTGTWSVDGDSRLVHRVLTKNGGYSSTVQLNTEPGSYDDIPQSAPNTQQDISEEFGMWPVERHQLGRYNTFALFCLMPDDYKAFLRWQKKDRFLDILFGINLAAAIERSEQLRENKYTPEGLEEDAKEQLRTTQNKRDELASTKTDLKHELTEVETELSDKRGELRRINETLDGDNELERLESQRRQVRRQLDKLESKRREKRTELRETRLRIERLSEVSGRSEFIEIAEELQKFTSVPDRCPVCTNDVTEDQRRRLLEHGECPLCAKDVPHDRIELGTEQDIEDQIIEREKQKDRLQEVEKSERQLEGDLETVESRIGDYENQLEAIESQIQDSDAEKLVNRREELEAKIDDLDQRTTRLQVEINAKEQEIENAAENITQLEEAVEAQVEKFRRQDTLRTFEKIINRKIKYERGSVKSAVEARMNALLRYFKTGTLADATGVNLDSDSGYDFTILIEDDDNIPSDRQNQNSNEGKLISLMFHTAVLQEVANQKETFPVRTFLFDSPYSEAPDKRNTKDITRFLKALPEELPNYQIILTVADSEMVDRETFKSGYTIEDMEAET